MKFSPKCRTKKLGKIYTTLGIFCSFLNLEGADYLPQIRPRKFVCLFVLLLYVPSQQLWSLRDGQLT